MSWGGVYSDGGATLPRPGCCELPCRVRPPNCRGSPPQQMSHPAQAPFHQELPAVFLRWGVLPVGMPAPGAPEPFHALLPTAPAQTSPIAAGLQVQSVLGGYKRQLLSLN